MPYLAVCEKNNWRCFQTEFPSKILETLVSRLIDSINFTCPNQPWSRNWLPFCKINIANIGNVNSFFVRNPSIPWTYGPSDSTPQKGYINTSNSMIIGGFSVSTNGFRRKVAALLSLHRSRIKASTSPSWLDKMYWKLWLFAKTDVCNIYNLGLDHTIFQKKS